MPDAKYFAAFVVLLVASVSFIGIGMMMSVLPLISPEKGTQLGFVAQGTLLVVSGVYYPVEVLPQWMQAIATISPATYALDGIREAILEAQGLTAMWDELWPLHDHRRRLDPARAVGVLPRRAVREEAREAEEERLMDAAVHVDGLLKVFDVPEREPGLVAAAKSLVRRKTREVRAVDGSRSRSRPARSSASWARTARARRRR